MTQGYKTLREEKGHIARESNLSGTMGEPAHKNAFEIEKENGKYDLQYDNVEGGIQDLRLAEADDDGRWPPRDGTWMTATAHIITAVIGSGVLSLGWSIAQMGWIFGPIVLLFFAGVTYYTAALLTEAYRKDNNPTGKRNYTYQMAVAAHLGPANQVFCAIIQYANLFATGIGYTVTASISLVAVKRSICFHHFDEDPNADCKFLNNPWMIMYGAIQIVLSQIPDFGGLWWLSYLATAMSFAYSFIGLGLSIGKATEKGHDDYGTIWGTITESSEAGATWNVFVGLGSMAFAYSFSMILIEIQDTLKPQAGEPREFETMTKAARIGIGITTFFYMSVGTISYAGFGDASPGNLLTGFGFFKPYWLVGAANVFVWIHLLGAYQVFMQPFMVWVEESFIYFIPALGWKKEYNFRYYGYFPLCPFKMISRTIIVCVTTLVALVLPFFNDLVGFIGALGFWPLTVHFPIEMHMTATKVRKFSGKYFLLRSLSILCLLVSLAAAVGSIEYVVNDLKTYKVFSSYSEGSNSAD